MLVLIETKYHLLRNRNRTALTVCIAVLLVCCMSLYIGSIQSNESALENLAEAIPVSAQIVSRDGTSSIGLEISENHVESLLNANIKNPVYTAFACGIIEEKSRLEGKITVIDTNITGANSISAFTGLTAEQITFLDGYGSSFLLEEEAVCMIDEQYALHNNLTIGDIVTMPLYSSRHKSDGYYIQFDSLGEHSIKIIGIYKQNAAAGAAPIHMIVPVKWLKIVTTEGGQRFLYDSFRCTLANPMELNTFKETAKASHFGKVVSNPGMMVMENSYKGDALVVDDQLFIETAEKLQQNLRVLRLFRIPFFTLTILLITLVTFQILRSTRQDIAIASSLGRSKFMSALVCFLGTFLADFTGCIIAFALLSAVTALSTVQILVIIGLFLLCAAVGVWTALLLLLRFDTMALLTKVD